METLTFKLERRHVQALKDRARVTGRSQGAVVRELIEQHLGSTTPSLHERSADLCGSLAGSRTLSTRRPDGYGRD